MIQEILTYLGAGHPWAGSVRYYESIDSTNTQAKALAETGAPQGTVLIAQRQTAGRGRMGNSFFSPENVGIYLSCILRPDCHASQLGHLTCAVGVKVCDSIAQTTGFRPRVKWINDLIAGNRKIGGILTELSLDAQGNVRYAVVGIGINCNQKAQDFPTSLQSIATSLAEATGRTVDRARLAACMIQDLHRLSRELIENKAELMNQYRSDCLTIRQEIVVLQGDRKRYGTALALNDDGSMIVQYTDGETSVVNSGEVHIRGLYGYC